eukprot:TRINITY_DN736_c0_g1_i1.p1 TRINITY_DN736_c0_g1~~TRINITY_DN736_c0_g1_i1.p1  ORF type:complete len:468 (-),score=103.84 TRINITY_DN736_c0_g1_i1:50-1453(-)
MTSVADLDPPDMDGHMTKCGGRIESWHKRWFVLKGNGLYYFKKKSDKRETGVIELTKESFVKKDPTKKQGKPCIAVGTTARVFFMYPETTTEQEEWIGVINAAIERLKGDTLPTTTPATVTNTSTTTTTTTTVTNTPVSTTTTNTAPTEAAPNTTQNSAGLDARTKYSNVKNVIPFMKDETSKVLEFWKIWFESVPSDTAQSGIDYTLVVSCDLQELSWRACGAQNVFIQTMVDFFWNVGAPETEIDRLNDFGALVNPGSIGYWINMSNTGGMDGGWFFPVPIGIRMALGACDPDLEEIKPPPTQLISGWVESKGLTDCVYVGRDMGAAPPRQTEFRIVMKGTAQEQLETAMSAFTGLNFPDIPENVRPLLEKNAKEGTTLSIITSSEGIVKVGILLPTPEWSNVLPLVEQGRTNSQQTASTDIFQTVHEHFNCDAPQFVEYQYLSPGFGYNVYKEEFNVHLHYRMY